MGDTKIRLFAVVMDKDHMDPTENTAITIDVYLSNSFEQLKLKVEEKLSFLRKHQIWFVNHLVPDDNSRIISTGILNYEPSCGGYIVYLYLALDDELNSENDLSCLKENIAEHLLTKCYDFQNVISLPNYVIDLDFPDDMEEWQCSKCTFKNLATNLQCGICSSDR